MTTAKLHYRVALPSLLVVGAWLAGCGVRPDETAVKAPPPPPRVMDPASASVGRQWLARWRFEPATAGDTVRYAFLIGESAPSGREGYSRLTCRLVLQDGDYKPVRRDGRIRMVLIASPNRPDERVVGVWQLDAATADGHYRYGIMPGYLLDLLWPRVEGVGTYRLVMRWTAPQGEAHVTTTFHFEDVFGYDLQTTPTTSTS